MCSKFNAIVLLMFVSHSSVNGDLRLIDTKKCTNNLTTTQYDYSKTFPIEEITNENEIFLSFFVQAGKDAHIIFSPKNEPVKKGEKAYEIVLGAARNTVSFIRTSRYKENVAKYKVANIVSDKEWRQFWIRIRFDGLIEVGRGNERSAFVKWKVSDPMTIKHYSFSSYNNNQVKWLFPCFENEKKENFLSSTKEIVGISTDSARVIEQKLKRDLLANYNASAPPKNQYSAFNTGNITIVGQKGHVVDGSMEMNGLVYVTWEDKRLSWNISKYNLPTLSVEYHSIWMPNISIRNNEIAKDTSMNLRTVTISHDGTVSQIIPLHAVIPACQSTLEPLSTNKTTCLTKVALTASKEIIFEAYDDPDEESAPTSNPHDESNSSVPDINLTLIYHYQN